jgi:hypothetical protein
VADFLIIVIRKLNDHGFAEDHLTVGAPKLGFLPQEKYLYFSQNVYKM